MFFTKVRPKINKLYENFSKKKIHLYDFLALLDDEPTLEELYQKMEDFKNFGEDEDHMNMYHEVYYDNVFIATLGAVQKRIDLSAIEVLMSFCNDKMHQMTELRGHWIDAFDCGPLPDVFREMFTHLHKGLPQGREMLAEYFYSYLIPLPEIESIFSNNVLYARKDAFLEVWEEIDIQIQDSEPYEPAPSSRNDHLLGTTHEERMAKYEERKARHEYRKALHTKTKDYYLKNYMRTVPCAAS